MTDQFLMVLCIPLCIGTFIGGFVVGVWVFSVMERKATERRIADEIDAARDNIKRGAYQRPGSSLHKGWKP